MKIYIAGAVSNLDWNYVVKKFEGSEEAIRKRGHEPISPLKVVIPEQAEWLPAMKQCVKALVDCDAIFLQEDWHQSRGATCEHRVAQMLGIPVYLNKKAIPINN